MLAGAGASRGPVSGDLGVPSGDLKILFSSSEVHGDGVGGRRSSQAMHGGKGEGRDLDASFKHGGRGGEWDSDSVDLDLLSGGDGLLSQAKSCKNHIARTLDSGVLDENMADVNAIIGRSMVQDGCGILGAYDGTSSHMAMDNDCRAQAKTHCSQGLNDGMSATVCMDSGCMHDIGILRSSSHEPCTSGVRCFASSDPEQKFSTVHRSRAASSPRHSHSMAWNRPKIIPMPPKKDLGKFSLDGMTALLDDGEVDVALKRLDGALIGRLFGRKIPYFQLSSELKRRWASYGEFRLITLRDDCFLCLFDCVAARDAILMEGPWVLFGQVLGLDKWTSSFSPSSLDGFSTPVWVRMPGLPFFCWTTMNIARIVALIGEPLWIDSATENMERGLFARACVRLDLSKPLKAGVWIEGKLVKFFQPLEYEGLSMFCFRCSQVGHKANNCKLAATKMTNVPCSNAPLQGADFAQPSTLDSDGIGLHSAVDPCCVAATDVSLQPVEERGAGPWMLVVRKRRTNKGKYKGEFRNPILQADAVDRPGHQHGAAVGANSHISRSSIDLRNHRSGAASSLLAGTRSPHHFLSKKWIPTLYRDSLSTSRADSLPSQASLSPAPPSLHPPLKEGDVQPILAVDSPMHGCAVQALPWDNSRLDVHQPMATLNVQNHASLTAQQDNAGQLMFEGFKAMPVCNTGQIDTPGAAKLGTKQRRGARLGGKAAVVPLSLPSPCAQDMPSGSCVLPKPTLCEDVSLYSVQDLDGASSLQGAIVPYNNHDAIARMALEGSKRKGVISLKMDKMLNDLGPISLSPRKRRMIIVPHDGGDASPSPPE